MKTQTNVDLGFPLRLYSLGCEPEPKRSINYHSKTEFLKKVKTVVGEKVWSDIRSSPLGVVVRFAELDFIWSSKLVKHLLVRQLVCKKKYELWCLFGNTPARFSLSEFKDITTLNCAPFPDSEDALETNAHVELWRKMNIDEKKNPSKKKLMSVVEDVRSWTDEKDKTCFAYLSILATVIIGNDWKTELPSPLARMVFNLSKFEKYPWGRVAFENLIKSVKGLKLEADTYTLHGFLQALQIWAYTVVPSLGAEIGRPLNVEGPPLLKFKGTKGKGNNIDIDAISNTDKEIIKSVVINELAPTNWKHDAEDIEIDTLLQAICKEGGLGFVTWAEHGSKSIQVEKNKEGKLGVNGNGNATETKGDEDAENVSLKHPKEIESEERKRMKAMESKSLNSSMEVETLCLMVEQQGKTIELLRTQIEDISNQLLIFEVMRSKLAFLENEMKMMKEKSMIEDKSDKQHLQTGENHGAKLPKIFEGYQLKDSSDTDTHVDEDTTTSDLFAKLNDLKASQKKFFESDEESTVDGSFPTRKIRKELPQQSSPLKIFQPTISVLEKFEEKKRSKTLKAMKIENDTNNAREKSKRVMKPGPSLQTPFRGTENVGITKIINQPITMVGRRYDPFTPVDVQKVKVLDDWLKLDEEYPVGSKKNGVEFFKILRTPQKWLNTEHINSAMNMLRLRFVKNQKSFRSERIAFTDVDFTAIWSQSYQNFLGSKDVPYFPNGAFDYANGTLPEFAQTRKKWMTDVDVIYGVLSLNQNHWVALIISIPERSIDVFDCKVKGCPNEDIFKAVKPIAHMLPHLLRATSPPSERPKMSVEQYKVRRPRQRIPQMLRDGDCGIYAIKFVECHSLLVEFTKPLSDANIKMVREKLAADIFYETEQHGHTISNPLPYAAKDL